MFVLKVASIAIKKYTIRVRLLFFSWNNRYFHILGTQRKHFIVMIESLWLIKKHFTQVSVPVSDSLDVSLASLKTCSSEETTTFSHDNVTSCQFKCSCDSKDECSEVFFFIATDKQWKLCEISALPWTFSSISCMHGFFVIVFFSNKVEEHH